MTDKEKYTCLMQRYWEAGTTPEEERDMAKYIAQMDDPDFEELRGVLGYLSIGREKKVRRARRVLFLPVAAVAASIVAVVAIGLGNHNHCVRYSYGEKTVDDKLIMASVESSLADFFGESTPAEANLLEMFER